ncbi:hypothetical protein JAAARDRAFT_31483 [Jaapia argillacea MUCL 33604]|uniref:Uncharacterized protein n=1 Tax=Jaapia argillacea MUCL 33604 TaxID=933084 RepID=A0A067QHD5_9AGAM|nr:hypothetical protein JAAARDRAFT_31483 [Jaapia argillacea MUCL 33604]
MSEQLPQPGQCKPIISPLVVVPLLRIPDPIFAPTTPPTPNPILPLLPRFLKTIQPVPVPHSLFDDLFILTPTKASMTHPPSRPHLPIETPHHNPPFNSPLCEVPILNNKSIQPHLHHMPSSPPSSPPPMFGYPKSHYQFLESFGEWLEESFADLVIPWMGVMRVCDGS